MKVKYIKNRAFQLCEIEMPEDEVIRKKILDFVERNCGYNINDVKEEDIKNIKVYVPFSFLDSFKDLFTS